ncbi:HNH endonuclease [Prosthecobacter sp.]|uniref:HNH endonuclease n=1 Tax=Prosthecobacter sp. TaxID=1965333 RepID=UPI003782F12B
MNRAIIDQVRQRASERCEYCGIPETDSGLRFHVEHIIACQHGGSDELGNLALACPDCNWNKGTNLTGIDPDTGDVTVLFHPQRDAWREHFQNDPPRIKGDTGTGRTTVWLLNMNHPLRLRHRLWLWQLGEWP